MKGMFEWFIYESFAILAVPYYGNLRMCLSSTNPVILQMTPTTEPVQPDVLSAVSLGIFFCFSIVLLVVVFYMFIHKLKYQFFPCTYYLKLVYILLPARSLILFMLLFFFLLQKIFFFLNFLYSLYYFSFVFPKCLHYLFQFFFSITFDVFLFSIFISSTLKYMLCCVILFFI